MPGYASIHCRLRVAEDGRRRENEDADEGERTRVEKDGMTTTPTQIKYVIYI